MSSLIKSLLYTTLGSVLFGLVGYVVGYATVQFFYQLGTLSFKLVGLG